MNRKQRRLAARGAKGKTSPPSGPGVGAEEAASLQATLEAAVRAHQAGQLSEAAALYEQALGRDPNNPDILHLLGIVTHQIGKSDAALRYIERAVALRPTSPDFRSNLGNVLRVQGRPEDAIAQYREALALKPDFAEAHNNLANALHDAGRLDEAITQYKAALRLNPSSARIHNNLGVAYKDQGEPAEAVRHYEAAIAIDPAYADAHVNLGNVLKARGLLDEAAEHYAKALALRPDLADAHIALAEVRAIQGRLGEAEAELRAVLALKPDSAEAYARLGTLLGQQGTPDEALGYIDKALALEPDLRRARKGFAALLGYAASTAYKPELERRLKESLAWPEVDPQHLARVASGQLRFKYDIGAAAGRPGPQFDAALVERIASDELFVSLLTRTVNVDGDLELFLTDLRRALLVEFRERKDVPEPGLRLASALAQQCFNNDYVFATDSDENQAVDELRDAIGGGVPSSKGKDRDVERKLLLFSMYAPLSELACAQELKDRPRDRWSPHLVEIVERTVLDFFEERELERDIPSVKDVTDETSRAVRRQYEESPYPRWISLPRESAGSYAEILRVAFPHFAPPANLSGPIRVLVAGCGTGRHPLNVALAYKGADVVAVDFSRASLAYAKRMANRLGVRNVEFLQADILDLAALGREFHVIECVGVLHHMKDPLEGWRVLAELLSPGGVMEIGLYSEKARRNVVEARGRIHEIGLKPVRDDIREFRTRILRGEEDPSLASLLDSPDFFSLSGCRDLLFNVKEHRFTLPAVKRALDELAMTFVGFVIPSPLIAREYRKHFPDDHHMTDLDSWDRFEDILPNAFCEMYQFVCQKRADA